MSSWSFVLVTRSISDVFQCFLMGYRGRYLESFFAVFEVLHACSIAQLCSTFCDPTDFGPPGSSVHGISQHEYWSGLPLATPGDLPDWGLNLCLLHCRQILYCWAPGEALFTVVLPTSGSGSPNPFSASSHPQLLFFHSSFSFFQSEVVMPAKSRSL